MKPRVSGTRHEVFGDKTYTWSVTWSCAGVPREYVFFTWDAAIDFANEMALEQDHRQHMTRWQLLP